MGKGYYMTWVGILAVLMGGCGSDGGESQPDVGSSPAVQPAPATTQAAAKKASQPEAEPELESIVDPLPSAPDLIQSTNPEQRIKEIEQSEGQQQDPFNILSLPPIVEFPEERPEPNRIIRPPIRGRETGAIAQGNGARNNGEEIEPIILPTFPQMEPLPPIGQLPLAVVEPPPAPAPPPELPPTPETATAVAVSGVMELGGELQAIVTAPDEPSRNVKVGDLLANGAVLVKRIEISSGRDPVVILEENGYEVARVLGDKPSSEE